MYACMGALVCQKRYKFNMMLIYIHETYATQGREGRGRGRARERERKRDSESERESEREREKTYKQISKDIKQSRQKCAKKATKKNQI